MKTQQEQKPIVEVETVTAERELYFVKVRVNKDHLDSVKVYAEMIHMDEDSLLEEILATGIKTIRGQINNLPYVSTKRLLKQYQTAPQTY